ncbi:MULTISPECIES: branched-chain amino acid ABC transporter ATP-binding protein/permease [unclassified Oceanobacter]|uniref:branched-chain amino acid ABC transporter ATP-binding protein/permease n=3 Tax=Gammaproteobacteria TaxID=1236 RepID=UPI0026E3F7E8|nr:MULTISPECIES: branched-chain amino acid ABC transporter ATP-binding protein/permease [unclassified Oceanobacter]MDO6683386.1 branched-chain amino acid ABC transporter ATP-binding protein/permease [Oceanobacter sp. 5_MG-2023]MDP2505936.1 branched-chain amino acid ABC transporter ATP-binding protein/permease [Oceanobacter sp. 3_MG-2023]MDP2547811.1 branched-chain amino acid ABC transporter ATP-binding protein/permease [Oceanobacter sp. 4_MG-2023]MDP2608414.1 branched-chain amino acid ABC trans
MRLGNITLALILLAIATTATVFGSTAMNNTVSYFFILVVLVVALGIYVGNTGIVSFGHPAFMAIAAYLTAILVMPAARKSALLPNLPDFLSTFSAPPLLGIVITVFVVGLIGAGIGLAISRLNGASATIATLGLLIVAHSLLVGGTTFTRGAQALYGIPKLVSPISAAIGAIITIFVADWFKHSRWGLAARAVREDEAAAAASGISIKRNRTIVFCLSIAFTALGGAMFALHLGVFSPKEFYFTLTFSLLAMLIVGGASSTAGAVVGVAVITMITEVLRQAEPGFSLGPIQIPALFGLTTIGISVALILTLYRRPEGIFGLKELDDFLPFDIKPRVYKRSVINTPRPTASQTPKSIRVQSLTKRYGGVTALDAVSIDLQQGEILGLIGPNGSGKSTFLSCASGIQRFDEGEVWVHDTQMAQGNPVAYAHNGVARTFQNIRLFARLSVAENVSAAMVSVPGPANSPTVADILTRVGLDGMALRTASTLSYGQQRRLEIARALAICPDFLLLDEPAAGMNSTETDDLAALIMSLRDENGLGILLVDHDLPMILRLSNRVAVLNEGKLIALASPEHIRENPEVAAAYFGEGQSTLSE